MRVIQKIKKGCCVSCCYVAIIYVVIFYDIDLKLYFQKNIKRNCQINIKWINNYKQFKCVCHLQNNNFLILFTNFYSLYSFNNLK